LLDFLFLIRFAAFAYVVHQPEEHSHRRCVTTKGTIGEKEDTYERGGDATNPVQ
jgi:hypothetical protein